MGIGLIRFEICLVLILFSVSLLNFLKVITSDQVDKSYTLDGCLTLQRDWGIPGSCSPEVQGDLDKHWNPYSREGFTSTNFVSVASGNSDLSKVAEVFLKINHQKSNLLGVTPKHSWLGSHTIPWVRKTSLGTTVALGYEPQRLREKCARIRKLQSCKVIVI